MSGPVLDRLDLQIEVPALSSTELLEARASEPSDAVRERVMAARATQRDRGFLNATSPTPRFTAPARSMPWDSG